MALVSDSIPFMVQGISQQPSEVRKPYQGEIQINGQSSLVDGLNKRPPSVHVAKLLTSSASNVSCHLINRGPTDRHIVLIQSDGTLGNTSLKVFDAVTGASRTVTNTASLNYLVTSDPRNDIRFLTILDQTYVLNRSKTTAAGSTTSANITLTEKQRFSDLPTTGVSTGDKFKIQGDDDDNFSTFYVEYQAGTVYEETVAPNIVVDLDQTSLPHKLTQSGSAFTFDVIDYADRLVGDATTNKSPAFIGKKLNAMFFFKNRFGVVAGQEVVFSESGEPDNFFKTTVTTNKDSDPIHVSVTHTRISEIEHAVPFNEQLMLFSATSQFFVDSNGALTGSTISVNPASDFEMDVKLAPIGAGINVYFAQASGQFSRIRELFVATDNSTTDAADITAHVPKYVPKNLTKIAASSSEDLMHMVSSDQPNRLYCYKYNWSGVDKNQSAWGFYEFASSDIILWIEIVENTTYMLVSRSDGVFLETMDYIGPDDTNLTYNAKLDRKVSLTGSYNAGTGNTTWTLPYEVATSTPLVVIKAHTTPDAGITITNTRPTTTTVVAVGDYSGFSCVIGVPYQFQYRFSTPYVREATGVSTSIGEKMAVTTGRLQLRRWSVTYKDTGAFTVEVAPEGRGLKSYEFTSKRVNLSSSSIERVALESGTFKFPIMARNTSVKIDVKSSSHFPCNLVQAEWEGNYSVQSRRM